jgi:WD40 repeat protein
MGSIITVQNQEEEEKVVTSESDTSMTSSEGSSFRESTLTGQVGQSERTEMDRRNRAADGDKKAFIFRFYSLISSHSSLQEAANMKKVFVARYPSQPLLASVGDDETLRIWDTHQHKTMASKCLGAQATCLCYSFDGAYLAIGFNSGVVFILDSKVEKLAYGNYIQEYDKPKLDILMSPRESNAAVLAVQFSN